MAWEAFLLSVHRSYIPLSRWPKPYYWTPAKLLSGCSSPILGKGELELAIASVAAFTPDSVHGLFGGPLE